MINKLITKELEKLEVAKVQEYDEVHHTFHFKKYEEQKYVKGKCYILRLDKHLLNATDNGLLVSNWNSGKFPTKEYVKCVVTNQIGKMIYTCGVYYNIVSNQEDDEEWIGWLPVEQVEVIEVTDL